MRAISAIKILLPPAAFVLPPSQVRACSTSPCLLSGTHIMHNPHNILKSVCDGLNVPIPFSVLVVVTAGAWGGAACPFVCSVC
ncbi:hypothetical protein B0H14DRAFT_3481565 [Mycena olivaceomarginata]|nr:hypothetical protein B0H14DRAFT_3481565 [Mycena olivaceomarginata]